MSGPEGFAIHSLPLSGGTVALAPLPGRGGDFGADLAQVLDWQPDLVISLTEAAEMAAKGAGPLGAALAGAGIGWLHLPVADYTVPDGDSAERWDRVAGRAHAVLAGGGRVLVHCHGGCGRSGMVALRLMVETGEPPEAALARLRAVRPCAVETRAQFDWAATSGVTGSTGQAAT